MINSPEKELFHVAETTEITKIPYFIITSEYRKYL